jgi:hypothetical protein
MRRALWSIAFIGVGSVLAGNAALAQPAPEPPASSEPAPEPPPSVEPAAAPPPAPAPAEPTRGDRMRAYHDAMRKRRLGSQEGVTERLSERVADAEALISAGRHDEAIAKLTAIVEHPSFAVSAETLEGRVALYLLGHALASAGITESARAYLRRAITTKGSWEAEGPYARRAVRRIVEVALETKAFDKGLSDLEGVPANAPPEVRAEIAYLRGRAKQAAGDLDGALAAFAEVPHTSRFWSQATYLSGLIQVERGRLREGENLFCKVADPKRHDRTVPVFADERFFAVRDLARLALGRVAHEQLRHDDARYYYYLVPRDSDRLAEALYEAATTRYEKKDYQGARDLLDELNALKAHHRYEDEAKILDAYIDLALCRFPSADAKLRTFLATYEPVRDAARRLRQSERGTRALLAAARSGADAAGTDAASLSVTPDQLRVLAALVRVDPVYGEIARKRAVLEREASGLRLTLGTITDMQRSLATAGGVRSAVEEDGDPLEKAADARAALDAVRRQLDDLEQAKAPPDKLAPLRKELSDLEARLGPTTAATAAASAQAAGADLPDLLRADAAYAAMLSREIEQTRNELAAAEAALARDALHRLDLRLSRLLRRARLGRIESVLGRKRALEIEIEAIHAGYLPRDAVDSLDAARYLKDNEEYWPFEGDDWPDEFVGSEGLR